MYSPSWRTAADVCARFCAQVMPGVTSSAAQPAARRRRRNAAASGREGLNIGLRPPEDERVDIVRALVGIDGFEVEDVADDVEFIVHAVAAMHVAGDARDIQRLAGG